MIKPMNGKMLALLLLMFLILVGGPGATKNFFVDNDYLHHELKKKVINTFDTGYTDESGLNELIDNAKSALQHLEVSHEKEMMERLFREIRKEDGGQSAYGESQVRTALEAGAVEILLISEGMKMIHRTFECPSCGKILKTYQGRGDEPVFKCPDDQSSCNLLEEEDIVDNGAVKWMTPSLIRVFSWFYTRIDPLDPVKKAPWTLRNRAAIINRP